LKSAEQCQEFFLKHEPPVVSFLTGTIVGIVVAWRRG